MLCAHNEESDEVLSALFRASPDEERAKLWQEELEILPKLAPEVRINSTLLEFIKTFSIVSVKPH
jgi:hypothetical protein